MLGTFSNSTSALALRLGKSGIQRQRSGTFKSVPLTSNCSVSQGFPAVQSYPVPSRVGLPSPSTGCC